MGSPTGTEFMHPTPAVCSERAPSPRRHAADPAARPWARGRRPCREASPTPQPADRRPRLRLRQTPPAPSRPRDHLRHRSPQHRARLRPRHRPLGRRTHLRAPTPIQTAARPLRTPRRNARSDARHRLLPHLLPPTTQTQSVMSSMHPTGVRLALGSAAARPTSSRGRRRSRRSGRCRPRRSPASARPDPRGRASPRR